MIRTLHRSAWVLLYAMLPCDSAPRSVLRTTPAMAVLKKDEPERCRHRAPRTHPFKHGSPPRCDVGRLSTAFFNRVFRYLRLEHMLQRTYFDYGEAYPGGTNKERRRQQVP